MFLPQLYIWKQLTVENVASHKVKKLVLEEENLGLWFTDYGNLWYPGACLYVFILIITWFHGINKIDITLFEQDIFQSSICNYLNCDQENECRY